MKSLPVFLFATILLYFGQEVECGFGTKHAVLRCRRSLSDVLHRRKRCALGAIETITVIGERWNNPWVTTITDPQAIRDFLRGMDSGVSISYDGAGGGTVNDDQNSESDCVDTAFLKELEGMETSGYVPKDNQVSFLM